MAKKVKDPNKEMSFLEHLEELRWHIIRSALAIVILAIVAFICKEMLFHEIIIKPSTPDFWTNRMFAKLADLFGSNGLRINSQPLDLVGLNMSDQFSASIWVSLIAGFIIAFPYIMFEVWRFISPALYENERKYSTGAVFYISLLFIIGVLFGYYIITPLSVDFLGGWQVSETVKNTISIKSYMTTVATISLSGGVVFELPILIYFLSKIGLVTPETLKFYRRHAYVGLLCLSTIITPPDVFSQIMVCIPLVLLYEVGIFIAKKVEREEVKAED